MSPVTIIDKLLKRKNTNKYINRKNQTARTLALLMTGLVFAGSLGGAVILTAQQIQIQSTQAAGVKSCPAGGTLDASGNNCLVDSIATNNLQNSCPKGGTLNNGKCVASLDNPINRSAEGCFLGGKEVSTDFGRGQEPSHKGKVCALPSEFTKVRGGRQGLVQLLELKPSFLSIDSDENPKNGVQVKGCESPNLGYNSQLISLAGTGVDIRQKLNSSHYMGVVNLNNNLICGFYSSQSFSTPELRDRFVENKMMSENEPCEFGSVESCISGTFYNLFYYSPLAVFSNYSYDSLTQPFCPTGSVIKSDTGQCSYPAVLSSAQNASILLKADCNPLSLEVGQSVNCTATFDAPVTGIITFVTNPNIGGCMTSPISSTDKSAQCSFIAINPGQNVPVSAILNNQPAINAGQLNIRQVEQTQARTAAFLASNSQNSSSSSQSAPQNVFNSQAPVSTGKFPNTSSTATVSSNNHQTTVRSGGIAILSMTSFFSGFGGFYLLKNNKKRDKMKVV